jgi:hypothetical protein
VQWGVLELSAPKFKPQQRPLSLSARRVGRSTIANKRYNVFVAVIAITAAFIIWRILALALLVSSGSGSCSQSCTPTMSLSSLSRARAAVLGSFVADAATVGVHWIYDQSKVNINKSNSLKIRTRRCCCLLDVLCAASPANCTGCRRALFGRFSIRHYNSYCLLCNVCSIFFAGS